MGQQINSKKLELAELIHEQDAIKRETTKYRKLQDIAKGEAQVARDQLRQLKSGVSEVTKKVRETTGSSRRITNPGKARERVLRDIDEHKNRLRGDCLSINDERTINRDIGLLEKELERIDAYIANNGEALHKERETRKKALDVQNRENEVFENAFTDVKNKADEWYTKRETNRTSQTEAKEEVARLISQKQKLEKSYADSVEKYKSYQREESEYRRLINQKSQFMENEPAEANVKVPKKQSKEDKEKSEKKKREEEEKRAKEEEAARQKKEDAKLKADALAERRKQAEAEYKRCQQDLAKRATAAPVAQAEEEEYKNDPNAELKGVCRRLIALCEQMKPSKGSPNKSKKKKKKKKARKLQHTPNNFSHFSRVGVDIPMVDSDLDNTIKALEDRIESYDRETIEE